MVRDGIQLLLRDGRVGPFETGPHPLRRIVGELDGGLEQGDRELGVDLGGDPTPESAVNLFGGKDSVEEFVHEVQS